MRLNKSLFNNLLIIIAVFAFVFALNSPVLAEVKNVSANVDKVMAYYKEQPAMDEWEALAIRWSGISPASKLGFSNPAIPSDYARVIMGSIAADKDAVHINGLIKDLQVMQLDKGCFSTAAEPNPTLNQTVWSLIALDFAKANGFSTSFDRYAAVNYIISQQDPEGGFDESGWGVDVDSTAHALISLAPYQDQKKVNTAIEKALTFFKKEQFASGGFGGWGAVNPDSTAAVIEALIALGIDMSAPEWVPADKTMVDALLSFQSGQGWFVYSLIPSEWNDPTRPNPVSTRNALLALGDIAAQKSKYQSKLPIPGNSSGGNGNGGSTPGNNPPTTGVAFIAVVGDSSTGVILPRQTWSWLGDKPSVLEALRAMLDKSGISYRITNNGYVTSIAGLAEKKPGYPLSGWLYTVNGNFYPTGAAYTWLNNGDDIRWLYSLDGGQDVGNPYVTPVKPEVDPALLAIQEWAQEVMKNLDSLLAAVIKGNHTYNPFELMSDRLRAQLMEQLQENRVDLSGKVDDENLWMVDPHKEVILRFPDERIKYPLQVAVKETAPIKQHKSAQLISEVFAVDLPGGNLSSSATMAIRVTIPPGVNAGSITPARFDADTQKWHPLQGAVDLKEGWVVFQLDQLGQYAIITLAEVSCDTSQPQPVNPTQYLIEHGIIQGTGNGFEWERLVNRAELAQLLYSLAGSPVIDKKNEYVDAKASEWHAPAISYLTQKNIMVGYPSGHFYPAEPINRYQIAVILDRWLNAQNVQSDGNEQVLVNEELPVWAADSVRRMLGQQIMEPISGSFAGNEPVNRKEAADLIYKVLRAS